jgi:hypothetical protein
MGHLIYQIQQEHQVKVPFVTLYIFSNKFQDIHKANTSQKPQQDLSLNPPSSGTIKAISKRTIEEVNKQENKTENPRKKARSRPSEKNGKPCSPHTKDCANNMCSSVYY